MGAICGIAWTLTYRIFDTKLHSLTSGTTSNGGYPTEVVGRFRRTVDAPRGARALLEEIAGGLSEGDCADLNIAISELVTNAVVHGSGAVTVRICRTDGSIRIEVTDAGDTEFEWPDVPEDGDEHGLGLHIVEQFTDRAGIERGPTTLVWCERDLAP